MTLTDFLLARIAEDEAVSRTWHSEDCDSYRPDFDGNTFPCDCTVSARVLAECEAKRQIVEEFRESEEAAKALDPDNPTPLYWQEWGTRHGLWSAVEHLAAVYADHPDYDPNWKP